MCFGHQFTNIGKPVPERKSSIKKLVEPPYAVNALLSFLVNNKINLRKVFANQIQSKRIKPQQLQDLCTSNNYQMSTGDFHAVLKFFAPPEGADSARGQHRETLTRRRRTVLPKQQTAESIQEIDIIKMVVYCRRIDPNYAPDDASAEGGPSRGQSKVSMASFPQRIKKILKRFSDYMIDRQITKEALFNELDRNNDDKITMEELVQFSTVNQLIEGVLPEDVEKLFTFLDTNQNGSISINEFCMMIEGINMSMQARMNSFSLEFNSKLKTEIQALFERLDKDRNQSLTADEFVQMVRPTDKTGSITLERAYEIVRQIDRDGDGRITKPEFVDFLLPRQKRQILDFEDQMEDLRRLFKDQIA